MATDYGVTNGLGREIQALEYSSATLPQGQVQPFFTRMTILWQAMTDTDQGGQAEIIHSAKKQWRQASRARRLGRARLGMSGIL